MLGRRAFDNGEGFRGEFGWLEREIVSRLERVAVFAVMMIAVFVLGTKNAFAKPLFISANEKSSLVPETMLVAPQRPSRAFWEFGYSRVNGLRGRGGIELNDAPTPTPQPNKGAEGANSETISGSEKDPLDPIIQEVQEKYPDVEFVVGHDQGAVSDAIIDQLKSSGEWEKLIAPQKKAVEALVESKELNHELNSLDPEALSQVTNDVLTILRYDSEHNRFMAPSGKSLTLEALNQKISKLAKKDPALAEILQEILQAVQSDTSMDWKNIRINTARFLQQKDPEKIRAFFVLLDIYRQWFKINGDPNPILHSLQITPFEVVPHGSVIAGSDLSYLLDNHASMFLQGVANVPEVSSFCDPNSPDSYGGCQFCYGYPSGFFAFIPNSSGKVRKAIAFVRATGQLKGEAGFYNYFLVDAITPNGEVETVLIQSKVENGATIVSAFVKFLQGLYPDMSNKMIYVVPLTDPRYNIGVAVNGNVHYPQIRLEWVQRILAGNSEGHSKETKEDGGQRSSFLQRFVGEIFKRAFLLQPR